MKKLNILTIHKNSWSYRKFRKNIFSILEKKSHVMFSNTNLYPFENNSILALFNAYKILNNINFNNFDLVFIYGIRQIILYSIFCRVVKRKKKNFLFFTGLGFLFINRNKFIKYIFFKILNFLFNRSDIIIAQNKIDHKVLKTIFKKNKVKLIQGNGIALRLIKKNENQKKLKKIIFASRLINNKGINELIEIINRVNKLNLNINYKFYLYFIIDNNNIDKAKITDNLLKLKSTKIIFNKKNIMKDIQDSDIAIFTSYREGLSQFLLECLSFNIPIITFDVAGCSDLVRDKFNGFLVKKGDITGFYKYINLLLVNGKLHKKFSFNSKLIAKNFSYQVISNKYSTLIK